MSGMKDSLWFVPLMALPSASGCLGAIDLRPSRGQHASSGSARLFTANVGYLDVSTLHMFNINIISLASSLIVSTTTEDLFMQHAFQDLTGYLWILGIVYLRPLRGRHAYKASLRLALPDSLQLCSEIWVPIHFV
jgi:hypothetical protein